jgi:L-iditol 2-dehydrogenase
VGAHAVRRAGIKPGDAVLVLGGGTIGLCTLACAIAAGATTTIISDAFDFNLEVARKLGATATVNVRQQDVNKVVAEVTGGKGVDAALVAIGLPVVVNQAVAAVHKRGRVVLIALFEEPITIKDTFAVVGGERELVGSQTYTGEDFQKALDLIASGQVDVKPMITHQLPIDQIQSAFEMVDKRLEDCIKVVLQH